VQYAPTSYVPPSRFSLCERLHRVSRKPVRVRLRREREFRRIGERSGRPDCCARAFLDGLYDGTVVGERARSVEELAERMRSAGPPTEDDVTVLRDGRRIDSREAAEVWLVELDAIRAAEAANQALDD
jgi:hypothetical protein